ncbi:hypothetical protein KR084_003726 [Drosophila pseudotakahashii]|nr:hypothetical protein KR084_003726 [Drosophila pseudotakahashii]
MPTVQCVVTFLILFHVGCPGLAVLQVEDQEEPRCTDCKSIQSKCSISKSGMFCPNKSDKQKIQFSRGYTDNSYDLKDCVPEKYTLTDPIEDWCCLWSPKIGCQQVAGTNYQNQTNWEKTCDICLTSCVCGEKAESCAVVKSPISPLSSWWTALGILVLVLVLSRSHPLQS